MRFKIYKNDNKIFCELADYEIKMEDLMKFERILSKHPSYFLALNLEKIKKVHPNFARFVKSGKILLFNAKTDIISFLYLTNVLNYTFLYQDKDDLMQDRRRFLKREFKLV